MDAYRRRRIPLIALRVLVSEKDLAKCTRWKCWCGLCPVQYGFCCVDAVLIVVKLKPFHRISVPRSDRSVICSYSLSAALPLAVRRVSVSRCYAIMYLVAFVALLQLLLGNSGLDWFADSHWSAIFSTEWMSRSVTVARLLSFHPCCTLALIH